MTDTTEITAHDIEGKTIEQLSETYGPPTFTEFVLDNNVGEFRVGLLNHFDKTQTAGGELVLKEVTFSLNEENNLTVWFHGSQYLRFLVYGKMADF
ncbi:hypothetical protein [Pseudophaeobacter sp.]|uniref:hypothetical protein n=1 Tax=Pseudophaeobacter sp. TaxID=1971739 RepID=UPI002616939D|nr:hypothetical protein [Pseudophaeobacter sp.]